jgi:hypothetical protein
MANRWRMLGVVLLLLATSVACKPGPTILVVGLDGADWDVMDPLIEGGHVPTLASVIQGGTRADFDCRPAWPAFSCYCPPVWVSIATGWPASQHGIYLLANLSTERTRKAIWQAYSDQGGVSVLSGYRNTYPPEHEGNTVVFTERGNRGIGRVNYKVWHATQVPENPNDSAFPESLYQGLGLVPFTTDWRDAHGFFAADRVSMEAIFRLSSLQWLLSPATGRPGLYMMIIHSIDKSEHTTWSQIQRTAGDPIDTDRIHSLAEAWTGPVYGPAPFAFGNVISQYMEADRWLEKLLASVHFDYVVFVSDHGMTRRASDVGLVGAHGPGQPEAHTGIFSITGPGVRAGAELEGVTVLDVAPTLAHILGMPIAEDLPGHFLADAFEDDWLANHPVETVATWEDTPE